MPVLLRQWNNDMLNILLKIITPYQFIYFFHSKPVLPIQISYDYIMTII